MDCFIKKIFEGKRDEFTHLQFQKFSRGEFKDKAVILFSQNKNGYSLSTTAEYGNEFVRAVAEKLGENKATVTGVVVTTRDLKGQLEFLSIKQFAGVKQYIVDREMTKSEILNICDKFPQAFIGFSFSTKDGTELKIKAKAPKSGKPNTKADELPKADFCKLKTRDWNLIRKFVFDPEINENAKKADMNHIFEINDIVLPKNEKDFAKMRELATRKGKIIRKINVDGKAFTKEVNFEA